MSDTPETDNLARGNHVVPTEWAEQLERERDEARAKFDTLAVENMLEVNKLCKERDEAREALREAIQFRDTSLNGYDLNAWMEAAGLKQ